MSTVEEMKILLEFLDAQDIEIGSELYFIREDLFQKIKDYKK
jgi:hypothetical protein